MKTLSVRRIPEHQPTLYDYKIQAAELERLVELFGEIAGDLDVRLQITCQLSVLKIEGELQKRLVFPCDRCAEPTLDEQKVHFSLQLFPQTTELSESLLLEKSDLDTDFYEGDTIHLFDIIEDQLLISFPVKRLCYVECRGLCSQCGANQNQHPCGCGAESNQDSPFASLTKHSTH